VLAAFCGLQFALTGAVDLPEVGWSAGGVRTVLPSVAFAASDPVLRQTAIFSPRRTAGAQDGPASPLGGTSIAGVIALRGHSYAVVQHADGSVARVPIGGRIAGFRLVALEPSEAILSGGGKPLHIPYGAAPPPQTSSGEDNEAEEHQE
jgi:hypothetical protein